jgi:hypothetical protein
VSVLILMVAMVAIMVDGIVIVVDIASAFGLLPRAHHADASIPMRLFTIAVGVLMYLGAEVGIVGDVGQGALRKVCGMVGEDPGDSATIPPSCHPPLKSGQPVIFPGKR